MAGGASEDLGALPAHLAYDPNQVADMGTLLLMARSAAASDFSDKSFWRTCSLQAQRFLSAQPPPLRDAASFLEAGARLSVGDSELLYNFGDAAVDAAESLDADTLGVALHAHALLGFRNDRVLKKLEACLFALMRDSRATASGLALSLRSLAKLHTSGLVPPPDKELLDAIGRMVSEHLNFFSVDHLCEILEAFGAYRIQGNAQASGMLVGVGGALARSAKTLSASQVAVASKAFAKCRVHDERLFTALGSRLRDQEVRGELTAPELVDTLYGFAKFTCQDTALLDLLSIEARRKLHAMNVPMVGSSLASLAKAGVSSPVLVSRAAVQLRRAAPEEWQAASVQELSVLAMAFAKLQARDDKLFDAVAEAILMKPYETLRKEPCTVFVNFAHAFTKVHVLHTGFFEVLNRTLLDRFEELAARDIVKFLHGAAKVDLTLPPSLQIEIEKALQVDEAISKLGVFELLKLAAAAKRLRLAVPSIEARIGTVLPLESHGQDALGAPRRKTAPKRRPPSVRRRKWTW